MIADAGGQIAAIDEGINALRHFGPLTSGRDLVAHWMTRLGKAERTAVTRLFEVIPKSLSKEGLGHRAGCDPDDGGFNNAHSTLRTFELVSGRGELRASEELV